MPGPSPMGAGGDGRFDPPVACDNATEWDSFVAAHPEGTIFHTRAWARILRAAFPGLGEASRIEVVDGTPCVLPLYAWTRAAGLFRTLHSSFPFAYGGPIPCRGESAADLGSRLIARLRHPFCSWRITGNPFAELPVAAPPPGFVAEEETTHLLRLPSGEDAYWDGILSTAQRNDWRRLARKGVTVEETRSEKDADAVHALYLASFAHWGGAPRFVYPRSFYRALLAHGGSSVRLTVIRHEGGLAGGCFVLRWNGKVHYLAGYFDREARALRPAVLLQVESILCAIRDGYAWYDFLPSGGHASVEEFKESLGGQRTSFRNWTRRGGLHRLRPGA